MEGTAPPAPVGSVSFTERLRHGPTPPPSEAAAGARSEHNGSEVLEAVEVAVAEVREVASVGGGAVSGRVLVLNATYEPINVCSIRRAVVLLLKEKAEMLERNARELHSERCTVARPVVIRLVSYVRVPHQAHRRKITRRAVFARDGWACQYCGSRSNLTVDHVVPRSKGGQSSWENIVASCGPCNRRKGDSLPAQVGMKLRRAPRIPRAEIFIHVSAPTIPSAWQPYLAQAA
jgi:5-methylcytosine-specific restriction endonuclease McrA